MKNNIIVRTLIALSIFTCISVVGSVKAFAAYPQKPIKLIVCYSAGGDADLTARVWADFAEKELGQPVIVVNKTGGGGVAGTTFAAHARPDGYTLFLAQAGAVLIAPQTVKTAYNFDSFTYISRIMIGNCAMVVAKDAPWNNLKEFAEAAKAVPGEYVFASPGATTWLTLATQQWAMDAGVELKQVEHQGSAPAITSLLGRHADITFAFPQIYVPQVEANSLKLLAIGARSEKFPHVSTFAEQGYDGSFFGWGGIAAPQGVSREVVDRISAATRAIMNNPDFIKALNNIHATPSYLDSTEWTSILDTQYKDLGIVVDKLGIRSK